MNSCLSSGWPSIASEAPEFTAAVMFALRGQAGLALGSLLSAKLNQWTLLVGMIPGGCALSRGSLATPIPMGSFQLNEILLTATQSLLAVILLLTLRLDIRRAKILFSLFLAQFLPFDSFAALMGSTPGLSHMQRRSAVGRKKWHRNRLLLQVQRGLA